MSDLDDFCDWLIERGRAESTARLYEGHLRLAFETDNPMERLYDSSLAPKTRLALLSALRAWGKFAEDKYLLERLDDFKRPQNARLGERPPLEAHELEALINVIDTSENIDDSMRSVLGMLATRGFRVGDVLRATRNELREANRTGIFRYTAKGGKRLRCTTKRFGHYLPGLLETTGWERVQDLLAPNAEDSYVTARLMVWRTLKALAVEAELDPNDLYPHRLRRTVAVNFLRASGGDIVKLQHYMGWSNISVAAGYVDYVKDDEIAEIEEKM